MLLRSGHRGDQTPITWANSILLALIHFVLLDEFTALITTFNKSETKNVVHQDNI